jgi:CheY-like chemotaxis protein
LKPKFLAIQTLIVDFAVVFAPAARSFWFRRFVSRNMRAWRQLGHTTILGNTRRSRGNSAMVQPTNDNNPLSGVRVLVVEDDALMAMDIEATLVEAGAVVVSVCQTVEKAIARVDASDFSVAVLDFGIGSDTASPVARQLARRGVPFIFYTGTSRNDPSLMEWSDCSIVEKPASRRALVSAVRTALSCEPYRTRSRR